MKIRQKRRKKKYQKIKNIPRIIGVYPGYMTDYRSVKLSKAGYYFNLICPHCMETRSNKKFCTQCGHLPIEVRAFKICQQCYHEQSDSHEHCEQCGTKIKDEYKYEAFQYIGPSNFHKKIRYNPTFEYIINYLKKNTLDCEDFCNKIGIENKHFFDA